MTDLDRAWALMDRIDDGVAERIEPTPHGHLVASKRLHRVYDENFLRVRDAAMVSAEELAAEAEAAQGRFPELRHRRVNIRDGDHAARLEPGFVELGWAPERFVLMIQRRPPGRPGSVEVDEVGAAELAEAWTAAGRSFGGADELVSQMGEHHRAVGAAVPTRYFAVAAERRVAAYCELYSFEGAGQVENVVTLPEFRGRGFARSLVLHAAGESRAAGNDLTFLVADADDWPRALYEKLGFDVAGRYARFLKALTTPGP